MYWDWLIGQIHVHWTYIVLYEKSVTVACLQRLHQIGISLGKGSEIKVHQPWLTSDDGYTSTVTGNLEDVIVTSDLSYPHLASATSLQVS